LPMIAKTLVFKRAVSKLKFKSEDVIVAYSFREFVLNVLIGTLKQKPRLICVRKCDHASEDLLVLRRPVLSFYRNIWNFVFGFSPMRYRFLTRDKRLGSIYSFIRNPYDFEYCMAPVQRVEQGGYQVPYPLAILSSRHQKLSKPNHPIIVFLGERYPFFDGMPMGSFIEEFNFILKYLRRAFPHHRLVFKPRFSIDELNLDLVGYEIKYQDVSLEALLTQNRNIERVISFKSSGSFIAALYGREGYLLYEMCKFPDYFKQTLDLYFKSYRDSVIFVQQLEDLHRVNQQEELNQIDDIKYLSQPLIKALLHADN